jgi:hypothetical protein
MKRIPKTLGIFGVALLGTLTASAAFAEAPEYVRVKSIAYAGSGCPAGSVATNVAPDRQAFTLLFDQYIAEVGPGVPFNQKRKNCQINLDLDYPSGWSYAVKKVSYSGFVDLDSRVTATAQTSIYFQGSAETAVAKKSITGPSSRSFDVTESFSSSSLAWSPCGARRSLNLNTQLLLTSSSSRASGLAVIDTDSGLPGGVNNLKLVWKRCY